MAGEGGRGVDRCNRLYAKCVDSADKYYNECKKKCVKIPLIGPIQTHGHTISPPYPFRLLGGFVNRNAVPIIFTVVLLLASVTMNVLQFQQLERNKQSSVVAAGLSSTAPLAASNPFSPNEPDQASTDSDSTIRMAISAALERKDLLEIGRSHRFSSADPAKQILIIDNWTRENMPLTLQNLTLEGADANEFVRAVAKQLSDLSDER